MPLTFNIINLELNLSILTAMKEELDAGGMKEGISESGSLRRDLPKALHRSVIGDALENVLNCTRREVGAQERTWE